MAKKTTREGERALWNRRKKILKSGGEKLKKSSPKKKNARTRFAVEKRGGTGRQRKEKGCSTTD